jgi:hypothetical protein
MIETLPVKSHRQGNCCALDAARRHFQKLQFQKLQPMKFQTQELCGAYFGEPALGCLFI